MAAPVPSEIKSVVAFIFFTNEEGKLIPNGTGFFVGVKNPSNPNSFSVYLVTAKHVLYKPKTTDFFDKVFVRLNKKDGGSQIGSIPIIAEGEQRTVFTHSDSSVDIAIIPFLPDQDKFDFKFLPDDMITTKETYKELKIREGSDVFFTGLFMPYPGAERNYPVVRFGKVALVTEEQIEWQGKLMELYLIEAGSYGGNSGAPVFFYLGSDREPGSIVVGSPILKLAGVMQGTFLDAHEIKIVETKKVPIAVSNMGIAAVVPGYKLHELLFSNELKGKRGF
ncbi:MAG: trypsin-like peptidase domain-containing protein [Deltaproteobacteria bacterium]|nr:trypsin-like peptidase domain-containing protein [Deltaproteobacteria bacterium]